jgi:hypothetical protein
MTRNIYKKKVKLTKNYAIKTYGGDDVQSHVFLTSVIVGGEWSASRPDRFIPRERAPGTHWIGSWVDPRAREMNILDSGIN